MAVLDGVRVVDFGQYIAGPLAALLLADNGAHVIHVDPPGGPRWKHPSDAFYNRGKRRITLDLKSSSDLQVARRLIDGADVVIENFRPGVMQRLGVGAEECTARNQRLVYCSIPGFASDDPRAGLAAWEGVVGAATDTYARLGEITARVEGDDPERPVFTALPLASNFAAFHAATAIVMALIARHRWGRGQRIEVPMFDAMFELVGANGISLNGTYPVPRSGNTRTYVCADGRRLFCNATSSPRFRRAFTAATGSDAPTDELLATRPAADWEQRINRAGAPSTRVRTPAEWLAEPHARQRGSVVQIEDPELGPTWMAGLQVHLSASPSVSPRPRRMPDADRDAVLSEASAAAPLTGKSLEEAHPGGALDGIRVLDFTQVVAGPCTGRILVEYGADVIKINNPRPEALTTAVALSGRPSDPGNQQHEHLNRGKQTLLLDLHQAGSQQVLEPLVRSADVLMQNFAQGMAERYGLGYADVRRSHPELVYFSLSAYGYGVPMGGYRGFEPNAQAVVGLMHRFGGDGPPQAQPYLLDDYGTGVRGAFAIGLGILHRLRTGQGQHIDISLVETATYHQAAFLLDYAGETWDEPSGLRATGYGPLQRLYRASDGWFFFGAGSAAQLTNVAGLDDLGQNDGQLERELEQRLAQLPVGVWVERLRAADIGAHALASIRDLMQDPWVRAHGLSLTQTIEGLGEMTMPGVAARLSRTPLRVGRPVHPVGSDAPDILASIGLADQLDRLVAAGVIDLSVREAAPV